MAGPYYKKMVGVYSTNPTRTSRFSRDSLNAAQNSSMMTRPQGNITDRLGTCGNTEDEEDFIPLIQGDVTFLGNHSFNKAKQKRPGKRGREYTEAESRSIRMDLQQIYDYQDHILTAQGQEYKSIPKSRPDSYHEVKLEREPGKQDQTETDEQGFYFDRGPHFDQDYFITARRPEHQSMSHSIPSIPDKHKFRQSEHGWQLYAKLSCRDMETIEQDLALTNSLDIWFTGKASGDWPQFLCSLRAHLLKASTSISMGPTVISHLGELTTIVLYTHPEIRSILYKYGSLRGDSADHLYSEMSSGSMSDLANDLLLTIHDISMLCPKVSNEVKVEDTKDIAWQQHSKDKCIISGCNDIADKDVYNKVMIRCICSSGCKKQPGKAFCEEHFTKFEERQKCSLCKEHSIQLMFEEMVTKDNRVISIVGEQPDQAEILAGTHGHQAKHLLKWWIGNSIATAVDEAKQNAEQESFIETIRFQNFDNHYMKMRNLFVTHLQLLDDTGPDDYHLFGLYPRDEDQSTILPRLEALRIWYGLYEGSFQSDPQTISEMISTEPVEDTEEMAQWRQERVVVMVVEHEGKPMNKPGIITCVHSNDEYTVKMDFNFRQIRVSAADMSRLNIYEGNDIVVISGKHKGKTGQLYKIIDPHGLINLKGFPDGRVIPEDDEDTFDVEDLWKLCLCGSDRDELKNPTRGESEYIGSDRGTAELGSHLDFSHEAFEDEPELHVCFAAEYSNVSINGRECPDRMSTMCILDPLGIQFVQVYGQAHVLRLLPDSQASRLLNFQPNMMLTAVNGVCIASMEYDDVVALVCSTVRPMTLSLVYDHFYKIQNLQADYSSDDEEMSLFSHTDDPTGRFCHWHRSCNRGCKNRWSMETFNRSGYVYDKDSGRVCTTSHFIMKWGVVTARWPLNAVPAYKIIVGTYSFGVFRNQEHVMYTTDASGNHPVPYETSMSMKSWAFWHGVHSMNSYAGYVEERIRITLNSAEKDILQQHIEERNLISRMKLRQLNWQRLRLLFIGQREEGCWLRLLNGDAVHAIGMQLLIDTDTQAAANNTISPDYGTDSPADDRDEGPTYDETGPETAPNLNPLNGLPPQFWIKINGASTACNILLTATMNDLVAKIEQITHVPRSQVKLSICTTSAANIWTNSWSVSIPIVDFGFVTGCTIEVSVLGRGSSENWMVMSPQTTTDSITDPMVTSGYTSIIINTSESIAIDTDVQIIETSLISESDSQIDDRNERLTNEESGNEDETNIGPIQDPACGEEVVCTSCGNTDYTYCCDCQCTCGASLGHLGLCIENTEMEATNDNETSLVSESDSLMDDRDETHVTLYDTMIQATNSNLRNDGGKNDLILKSAANGAGARSPFSQASPISESVHEGKLMDLHPEQQSIMPMDESDTDDSDGEIFGNNQRDHPLLHVESAEVVVVKCKTKHFTAVLVSVEHVHIPDAQTTLSEQLNCTRRAQQQVVYYFSSADKPQEYELVSSIHISPIADIDDIKALKCNHDHIQQAKIFRAQHMAYHARTVKCKSLPEIDVEDEQKQETTTQLLSQNSAAEAPLIAEIGPSSYVIYQIPTVEHILATRQVTDTQQLMHVEYLVKWVGRNLDDCSWVSSSDLGYDATFLIKNYDAERAGQQVWKTLFVTAYRRTIVIVITNKDTLGIRFAITGDQAERKRFVCSINEDSPLMILSRNKLQVGAVLVSVNKDSSYNSNQIGTICKTRPLELEFNQSAYPGLCESLQGIIAEDSDHAIFIPEVTLETQRHVLSANGDLFPPIMRNIMMAQRNADSYTDYHSGMGNSIADLDSSYDSTDPTANGIYLHSLGSSLSRWLLGLGCESCLRLFNYYGVFTLAHLFCRDMSLSGLTMIREGKFGHNMSELQQQRLTTATDGVYSVFAVLTHMVNQICSGDYESCIDGHVASIDKEEDREFSDRVIPRTLTAIIDQTCQQNLQTIVHSSRQLGLIGEHNILQPSGVADAHSSKSYQLSPTVSSEQSVTTTDGKSRHNLLESYASSLPSNQIAHTSTNKRRSESPHEHSLLKLHDLKVLYTYAYGTQPRGPHANNASWLDGRILAAQFDAMDQNADPDCQSKHTEGMGNTFTNIDNNCSTIVTRAAQQEIDLTANSACFANDHNSSQNSPKRQRISDGAMNMKGSMQAPTDAAILELKNEYKAHFGHFPRGRFASKSSWLTTAITEKNRLTSTTRSIADISTSQLPLIPESTSDAPNNASRFGRKWLTLGLSAIPTSDYSFTAGDKGMTFGASTAGSVHIKTIATGGMAARLFGHKLRVGCLVISVQGPNVFDESISGETDALTIVRAHALLSCVLTISAPPDDTITWMTDAISDRRSAEELELLTQTTMAVQSEIGPSPNDRSGVLEPSLIQTDDHQHWTVHIDGMLMG